MKNKGQVTIFVIVGIVVVVLFLLFFFLRSSIKEETSISSAPNAPNQYLSECVSDHLAEASNIILKNNGYISKDDYKKSIEYEYTKIPYLCYTEGFYKRCETQEPALISHLNDEIYNYMDEKIDECFESLKSDFIKDGFNLLSEGEKSFVVELMPNKIKIEITKNLKFSKAGESKDFNEFVANSVSPLYDIALIVQRINNEEALWANSEYLNIMRANPNIDINKITLGDDNEIYDITDIKTGLVWRFAIRGGVLSTPN